MDPHDQQEWVSSGRGWVVIVVRAELVIVSESSYFKNLMFQNLIPVQGGRHFAGALVVW
jgi:hypothetical protein